MQKRKSGIETDEYLDFCIGVISQILTDVLRMIHLHVTDLPDDLKLKEYREALNTKHF